MSNKIVFAICLIISSCQPEKECKSEIQDTELKIVETISPLYLSQIDFSQKKQITSSKKVTIEIQKIINNYYYEVVGDTATNDFKIISKTYGINNAYFNTLEIKSDSIIAYIIILKPFVGDYTSKILLYNFKTDFFYLPAINFNLYANYELNDKNKFRASDLRKHFKINTPDVEFANINNCKAIRLARLYHNGSSNMFETTLLKLGTNAWDTLEFNREDYLGVIEAQK